MFGFRKKQSPVDTPDINIPAPVTSRVEIELSKDANKDAAEKAKQVNAHVNDLLVQNGFTLKIYLAAGGHLPAKSKRGNG